MRSGPNGPAKLGTVSTSARLFALLGLPAGLFAAITWQVVTHGPLLRLDSRLSRDLVHRDGFGAYLSDLGNIQVAVPVLAAAVLYVLWRGRSTGTERWWLPPAAAAVLMALVPAIVVPLKDWTARPGTPVVPPAVGYFPSGHTATAAVAYGSATLLLLPWLRSTAARRSLVAGCAVLVLGVSYGLVRHGWHWPMDVVASWCLCTVLLTALSLVPGVSKKPGVLKKAEALTGPGVLTKPGVLTEEGTRGSG
ncbi:phosphatase PAP2 family protein [Streptomyces barringtoniae]|uniref:phosphatase PAP2 family protein n=1 Tax=Streptomyces barringtoniae TaxID=2892029 RepID=UPI00355850A1